MNTQAASRPENFEWNAWPARQQPKRALLASVVVILVAMAVGVFAQGFGASMIEIAIWTAASLVVLVASLHRFFFPSRFVIDEEGITAKYAIHTQRIEWKQVRRFVHDERGAYLCSRARPSRFDAFRGVHILLSDDSREQALRLIRDRIEDARPGAGAAATAREPDVGRDEPLPTGEAS